MAKKKKMKNPCWKGFIAYGMKMKGGKKVPNCVQEEKVMATKKGVAAYNRKTGGNLKTAVTEKNATGKRAARRRSFCARMKGMKGPLKDKKGRPTRKAMSLRRWRC